MDLYIGIEVDNIIFVLNCRWFWGLSATFLITSSKTLSKHQSVQFKESYLINDFFFSQ